ncbi:D-2-hydroxyacid dehydrogenase family protein [Monashia sp. NPDC004114]
MPTVTILDDYQRVALSSADWSAVLASHDIAVIDHHLSTDDDVARALAATEVVVAMRERTPLQASLIERLPELRLIVTTGMRNAAIDVDAARDHGITVCGTQGSTSSVPELTIGMMIALMRGFVAEDAAMRSGGWQHTIGPRLAGNTLGVIGLGRLGGPVATLAQAFGMKVVAWSPNLTPERAEPYAVTAVSKEHLLSESDVITIHMPLSERSRGLLGAGDLALMKHTAYLVNTSRGPIVDEDALVDALREGRIAGAALDVYDVEPLPADHPLRALPNTLLLPHIGYVTTETYREWFAQVVEDIVAWRDGAPMRVLD